MVRGWDFLLNKFVRDSVLGYCLFFHLYSLKIRCENLNLIENHRCSKNPGGAVMIEIYVASMDIELHLLIQAMMCNSSPFFL